MVNFRWNRNISMSNLGAILGYEQQIPLIQGQIMGKEILPTWFHGETTPERRLQHNEIKLIAYGVFNRQT